MSPIVLRLLYAPLGVAQYVLVLLPQSDRQPTRYPVPKETRTL